MAGHSIPAVEALLVPGVGNTAAVVVVGGSMCLVVVGADIVVVGVGIVVVEGIAEGDHMSSRLDRRRILPEEDMMGVDPKRC